MDPALLARMAVAAGLTGWVEDKTALRVQRFDAGIRFHGTNTGSLRSFGCTYCVAIPVRSVNVSRLSVCNAGYLFFNLFPARPLLHECSTVPKGAQQSRAKVAHGSFTFAT